MDIMDMQRYLGVPGHVIVLHIRRLEGHSLLDAIMDMAEAFGRSRDVWPENHGKTMAKIMETTGESSCFLYHFG